MSGVVLVTGATGTVGSEVIRGLLARDVKVRATVRARADEARLPAGAQGVLFDFEDQATFSAALAGVDRVFLMRPPYMADADAFLPFLNAMREAEVRQVAFLSLMGADKNPVVPHRAIEKRLRVSGLDWTMIRPSFFMQNLSTTHLADIREHSEIFVPAGKGATSLIDARDVGEACAIVLAQEGHLGAAYTITGPEALTYESAAYIMSNVLGRTIAYSHPSGRVFAARFADRGYPKEFITVMRGIYMVARIGMAGGLTGDLKLLLGRTGRTFREFVEDNAGVFAPTDSEVDSFALRSTDA